MTTADVLGNNLTETTAELGLIYVDDSAAMALSDVVLIHHPAG
jgi:hypothetical protein